MKRDTKIILLACFSILLLAISVLLLTTNYSTYTILTFTVTIVLVTYTILYYNETKDIYSIYKNELKRILNTYDSILVKSSALPNMKKHNIIKVASMEDLVYAQMVIKKPIYFYEEEKNCSFILIDEKEVCVYILKTQDDLISATDIIIDEIRSAPIQEDIDHSILDDIENTTIIKLDNHKTYKVSPIKPKNTLKDVTQVIDVIKEKQDDKPVEVEETTFEEEINLQEVAEAIDRVVELSNTGVLNLIKSEPIKNKKIKNVEDVIKPKESKKENQKEEKKEAKKKVVENIEEQVKEKNIKKDNENLQIAEEKPTPKKTTKRRKRSSSKKTITKEN